MSLPLPGIVFVVWEVRLAGLSCVTDDLVLQAHPDLRSFQLTLVAPLLAGIFGRKTLHSLDFICVEVNLLQQHIVILLHLDHQLVFCFHKLQIQLLALFTVPLLHVMLLLLDSLL